MYADRLPADSPIARAAGYASQRAARPNQEYLDCLVAISRRVNLAVIGASVAVIVSWFAGLRPLIQVVPVATSMSAWTAVLFLVTALLALSVRLRSPPWFGLLWHLGAVGALVLVLLFMDESIEGSNFGLAMMWPFNHSPLAAELDRPSFATGLVVVFFTVGLIMTRQGENRVSQTLFISGGLLAMFSLNSYALGAESALSFGVYENMSVSSAVLALALGFGIISATLNGGPLRIVASHGEGGELVRRVLPGSVLGMFFIAMIAGQLIGRTQINYVVILAFGLTGAMFMVSALIYSQAIALRRVDARRSGAEEALEAVRELMRSRDELTRQLDEQSRALRQIIDTSPDAFVAMDEAGRVTSWNPAAEEIFGWSKDEVMGKPLHQLIVPEFEQWVKGGGDFPDRVGSIEAFQSRSTDVDSVRKDGSRVKVDLTLWPATEEPSRAYYAFARDVTTKRDSEERLLEANADLREFAAIAAHDLRNPLVAVRLAAEMLAESTKDGVLDENGQEWIGRIQAATLRGQELITDLLEYSSLSSGPRETSRVDLGRLVEEVAEQVSVGTDREFSVEFDALPVIEGDLPRLRQLLANLLGNAAKYVPDDRPAKITVTSRTGRRMVRLTIADNGDGIPLADRSTVFGAFQRGSANRDTPGTGIGLAICRKVVERHGGTIRVEEADGGGAAFVIELPRWPGAMTIGLGGEVPTSLASGYAL